MTTPTITQLYLSRLLLNPHSRQVQNELAQPYEMHRTILRAFPDREEGGPGRVLFRVDMKSDSSRLVLLVQSDKEPKWDKITKQHLDYLAEEPDHKKFDPTLTPGQKLIFRLRANPTVKRNGKRLGIMSEKERTEWLERKASQSGFKIKPSDVLIISENNATAIKVSADNRQTMIFSSAIFEGILEVQDPGRFNQTLQSGIGSAKSFGFGMLSIAPA